MEEVITSIKNKIELIENTLGNLSEEEQITLARKLMQVNRDLRGVILFQLAVNKR